MEIKDKIVIVTGASQGIGEAASRMLGGLGAKVVLAARSEDLLKKLESDIPGSFAVVTDMMKTADIQNLVKQTMEKFGRIDILVNNAGQGMHGFSVENTPIEKYKEIMELNVFSVVEMMQAVVPIMKKQNGGTIVNISSMLSKMKIPMLAAYSSTKYALNAVSFIARKELAPYGITVSVVLPKMTETNFMKNSIRSPPQTENHQNQANQGPQRQMPSSDTAETVAQKIVEIIRTGEEEVSL